VKLLGSTFFDRLAEKVAHDLLGCRWVDYAGAVWSAKPYRFSLKATR